MLTASRQEAAFCIECGCDDYHACAVGCSWVRLDREAGLGVCSECLHRVADWDLGDRSLGEDADLVLAMLGDAPGG
ncbi:MAG: hypothetical protein M1492_03485 [Gammaproteobacteria bacterium]|nr:hypothetical protein [Gammaproteobacteria bacterium]